MRTGVCSVYPEERTELAVGYPNLFCTVRVVMLSMISF